ncbi:MAG TPA: hypothetical protein VFL31_00430 [Nitrospiraceae bacterium]|nr:hypothetical protein [Nitrospiraceae bacterium]
MTEPTKSAHSSAATEGPEWSARAAAWGGALGHLRDAGLGSGGEATAGQMRRLRAVGAKACLTKPIDVRKLLKLFDEILNERGGDLRESTKSVATSEEPPAGDDRAVSECRMTERY